MKYWEKMYGKQSKDFVQGVIAGVEFCAVWKDGIQVSGIAEQPLKTVIAEIKEQLSQKRRIK